MIHKFAAMFGHLLIGRILATAAPVIALVMIVTSLLQDGNSFSTEIWRTSVSIGLGVFLTLAGMLYHNLENRLAKVEDAMLPRTEFSIAHESLRGQLSRIENHVDDLNKKLL